MKRTQVQLEEEVWEKIRELAFRNKSSISSIVRHALEQQVLGAPKPKKRRAIFSFIGSGGSKGEGAGAIAQQHDKELSKAFAA